MTLRFSELSTVCENGKGGQCELQARRKCGPEHCEVLYKLHKTEELRRRTRSSRGLSTQSGRKQHVLDVFPLHAVMLFANRRANLDHPVLLTGSFHTWANRRNQKDEGQRRVSFHNSYSDTKKDVRAPIAFTYITYICFSACSIMITVHNANIRVCSFLH